MSHEETWQHTTVTSTVPEHAVTLHTSSATQQLHLPVGNTSWQELRPPDPHSIASNLDAKSTYMCENTVPTVSISNIPNNARNTDYVEQALVMLGQNTSLHINFIPFKLSDSLLQF